jgi:hypothetical protein
MKFYYEYDEVIRPVKGPEEERRKRSYRQPSSGVLNTEEASPKEFFVRLQKEFGKCISACYVDDDDGKARKIGWVFLKRGQYDDTREPFTQETWVTWLERCPHNCSRGYLPHYTDDNLPGLPTDEALENECSIQDNPL